MLTQFLSNTKTTYSKHKYEFKEKFDPEECIL